jgi:multicomponent Na+:H+ antiporter subunit E
MKAFTGNIFLTFVWVMLTMKLSYENIIFGFLVSYFILWGVQRNNKESRYFKFIPNTFSFCWCFIKQLVGGSIKLGYDIITPNHYMKPGIIAVPLDAKTDLEITLLANAITLTPGTTSIAVSEDKSILYVYSVYVDDDKQKTIDDIKNSLEKKLLEVLR